MGTEAEHEVTPDDPIDSSTGDDALPNTTLVQIEDDLAILYGQNPPNDLEVIPFSLIDDQTLDTVSTAIATASGFGNLAAQGANGLMQARGLVRLAPETLQQLKTATPMLKDGFNLGTLASEGKFVAQIRWLPAGGASAASVISSMGPAVAMMAIQFQLNQIANLAQHNVELTSTVLQVLRQERWSRIIGYHRTLTRELNNARDVGAVTDSIYNEVRGCERELTADWDISETAVRTYVEELRAKVRHKDRRRYLTDHGEAIISDVQALLLSQTSWFIYQALRASHLLPSAKSHSQDAALLSKVVADARQRHDETLDATDFLLDSLAKEFALIGELPGKRTFKIGGSSRAAKDASRMVHRLRKDLASVRGLPAPEGLAPLNSPLTRVLPEARIPGPLRKILPFHLRKNEQVLGLADATCSGVSRHPRDAGWVVVTDQRVLIARQNDLRRFGIIQREFSLHDLRYVRVHHRRDHPPTLDLITKDVNLTLIFPSWAKRQSYRSDIERFSETLARFMHIPESEKPSSV